MVAFGIGAGAKAAEGATDIATMLAASAEILTIVEYLIKKCRGGEEVFEIGLGWEGQM